MPHLIKKFVTASCLLILLAVFAACSKPTANSPNCEWGFYRNADNGCVRWPSSKVSVRMAPSFSKIAGSDDLTIVNGVVSDWHQAMVDVDFVPQSGSEAAAQASEIVIRVIPAESWSGGEKIPAWTSLKYNQFITSADIQINGGLPYSNSPNGSAYHLPSILRHEFGHALGLTHYTDDRKSVMFPVIEINEIKAIVFMDWWQLSHVYQLSHWPVLPPRGTAP